LKQRSSPVGSGIAIIVAIGMTLPLSGCGAGEASADAPPRATATAVATTAPAPPPSSAPVASVEPPVVEPPKPPPDPCEAPVPGMACIAAGEFLRGVDEGNDNEKPQSKIDMDSYFMDVTEVTAGMHDACVAAKKCEFAHTIYPDMSRPNQPKTGASWYDATNYCKAVGKHLPTEAEWEKAARGTDGRLYPWGNDPATCDRSILMDKTGRGCGVRQKSGEPDKGRTWVVGSRPPNQYGLYDMSGNAWEWTADFYTPSWAACGAACQGKNPKGPCDGKFPCPRMGDRSVRGGSWFWPPSHATTVYRRHHIPTNNPYHHYGFRCAASLEEAKAIRANGGNPPWVAASPPYSPPVPGNDPALATHPFTPQPDTMPPSTSAKPPGAAPTATPAATATPKATPAP